MNSSPTHVQPATSDLDVEAAVAVFSLLADATRVKIVLALRAGECTVSELVGVTGRSQAAVSQHLAKLRLAHMVTARHEGTKAHYRLINEHAARLVTDALHQAEHALGEPAHHQDAS